MKHCCSLFRYAFFSVCLVLVGSGAFANANDSLSWVQKDSLRIDSLKQLLTTQKLTGKHKMVIFDEIAILFHGHALDSSTVYYSKALLLAQELNEYDKMMEMGIQIGINHSYQGKYELAFACYERSIALAKKYGNKKMEAFGLRSMGFTYAKQGKHNTAIDYYLQFLKHFESEGTTENKVITLANLSEINRRLGNTEMAIQYLKQAEEISEKITEYRYEWVMPQIYNEFAFNYLNKGDYDEALRYALKADSINSSSGTVNYCYTYGILARVYLFRNDFDRANYYAEESYKKAQILKDVSLYIYAGTILSDVYLAQKRYSEAEAEAFKAWQIDTTNLDESRKLVENIAFAHIQMGNKEKAAYYLQKFSTLNAQYSEKSFQTTVSDLSIKYETEKKVERINTLEKKRQLYVWLIVFGGLLITALVIVLMITVRYTRKQQQLIANEAVQKGELGERSRIAQDLHDRLGGSLTAMKIGLNNAESIQTIGEKLDTCIKELRDITNNIMPRSLEKFGMKGALEDFCVDVPNLHFHFFGENLRIHRNQEYAVYCCAKELVNNALKHAGATTINVQLVQSKKHVSLTVQDDGCGFDEKTVKKGHGLENIQNRVASCNGKIDITSSPGKGTETVIELKM